MEDAPKTIDDEHLIKLSDTMGRQPDRLFSSWGHGSKDFGPDGECLIVAEGRDGGDVEGVDYAALKAKWRRQRSCFGPDGDMKSDYCRQASDGGCAGTHWHALNLPTLSRICSIHGSRQHNEAEERDIMHLLRWVIQSKAKERPAVKVILRHK